MIPIAALMVLPFSFMFLAGACCCPLVLAIIGFVVYKMVSKRKTTDDEHEQKG